jgi:hypothetical protein
MPSAGRFEQRGGQPHEPEDLPVKVVEFGLEYRRQLSSVPKKNWSNSTRSSLKALRLSSVSVTGLVSFRRSRRSHLFALMLA